MTTMLSANRRDADEARPFHAPACLFENLQVVLVDLIEFHPRFEPQVPAPISNGRRSVRGNPARLLNAVSEGLASPQDLAQTETATSQARIGEARHGGEQ